jgi:phosphate transport system regulatory protein PhoU
MKHTEEELIRIKEEVAEMWRLVLSQLEKARMALLSNDIDQAREVISREKRVDSFELKIDSDCENYIALYAPVAVDLRLVLSLIKITGTLERIADFAEGIARHVVESKCYFLIDKLKEDLQLELMLETVLEMLSESYVSLESENSKLSGKILSMDDRIDEIYHQAITVLSDYINENPAEARCALNTLLLIRKIERIGDRCSNIVEEIVFYIDAKVLKHSTE